MDAELHHSLAKIYDNGKFDVKRDEHKAAEYYESSIDNPFPRFGLGKKPI